MRNQKKLAVVVAVFLCLILLVLSDTDPKDFEILIQFRKGLENPELLNWTDKGDDPCGSNWKHISCNGNRVTSIDVQKLGLKGSLPQNFNQLTELDNLSFQENKFTGKLPTFKGLSKLRHAYLGDNKFDTIPSDFADGLDSLEELSLHHNPLNSTTGWFIFPELRNSVQLAKLFLTNCNVVGSIPDFLGTISSLVILQLAYNSLTGEIPSSFQQASLLQQLWLNNQQGIGLSGSIDVISNMTSLKSLWLHGNQFTGMIPADIGKLVSLTQLKLNRNKLFGPIPDSLAGLDLQELDLSNNYFMGSIPKFKSVTKFSFHSNPLCQSVQGVPCSPEVTALIDFIGHLNYPYSFIKSWIGNDPCQNWPGVSCNQTMRKVSALNFARSGLNGTLSASIGKLDYLTVINLRENNITGTIPSNLTSLKYLKTLDLSDNNIEPPLPIFNINVNLVVTGNHLLDGNHNADSPSPSSSPNIPSPNTPSNSSAPGNKLVVIIAPILSFVILVVLVISLSIYCWKKRKNTLKGSSSYVIHPRDASDPENMVKIAISDNNGSLLSINTTGTSESHTIESGNLVISVQILRSVTKNFAPENELGKGGFGRVYKGELEDGTKIAVKRMEGTLISEKSLKEFESEIAVLSKVRHRHLVSLFGYSIEGNERLLVYEYMPQGALSLHLFKRGSLNLEPLSWMRRFSIALDVARGMEYLHNLARESFIHRDLKSSNILLGDDFRAKVSDFGLVKLAPNGAQSMVTQIAGTFGYLAPEYAITGKITTKADVFSFGVVLMELLTGLVALDENRPEESRYLASWFGKIKSNKETLRANIDPALEVNDETFECICVIADLAGYCTAREPYQRPDMSQAVNILSPLVEKWKPSPDDIEDYSGLDFNQPLDQLLKSWQDSEGDTCSFSGTNDDSKSSIPSRPDTFTEKLTSANAR